MNFWVVKCRQSKPNGKKGWHWDEYFVKACNVSNGWGGEDWIKNNESKKYIRDEVAKGDLAVCYQYEGQEIMGLASMVRDGAEEIKNSGNYNILFFTQSKRALQLDPPLTLQKLRSAGSNPKCFRHGRQGTVFPLDSKEFKGILSAITDLYPQKRKTLGRWLAEVGYRFRPYRS